MSCLPFKTKWKGQPLCLEEHMGAQIYGLVDSLEAKRKNHNIVGEFGF